MDENSSINESSQVSCENKIAIVEFPWLDAFQEASITALCPKLGAAIPCPDV